MTYFLHDVEMLLQFIFILLSEYSARGFITGIAIVLCGLLHFKCIDEALYAFSSTLYNTSTMTHTMTLTFF